jgi:hypothetical protein
MEEVDVDGKAVDAAVEKPSADSDLALDSTKSPLEEGASK